MFYNYGIPGELGFSSWHNLCIGAGVRAPRERRESNTIDGLDTEPASNPVTPPRNHPWWDISNFYEHKKELNMAFWWNLRNLFWVFNVASHSIIVICWCLDRTLPSHTIHYNWVICSHHDLNLFLTIAGPLSHFWPPHTIHLTVPSTSILIVVTTLYITLHYPNFTPSPANYYHSNWLQILCFYIVKFLNKCKSSCFKIPCVLVS